MSPPKITKDGRGDRARIWLTMALKTGVLIKFSGAGGSPWVSLRLSARKTKRRLSPFLPLSLPDPLSLEHDKAMDVQSTAIKIKICRLILSKVLSFTLMATSGISLFIIKSSGFLTAQTMEKSLSKTG